ncbi:transforming growth factor beta regulator 1-like isoform X2 [Ylistrum balloti]|uniref:transforming growth factor beta regulator 1-like isoform X2 n=1 Tax=Ylistrum balloti TaxID=509963 RepID=UPI002905BCC8|nr:transforming growth factor beta regulator 1-like isoform X2 [Ylistrum balloti]
MERNHIPGEASNNIFSQDSAFLQQYEAGLQKQNVKPTASQHISLLTGKVGTAFTADQTVMPGMAAQTIMQPVGGVSKVRPNVIQASHPSLVSGSPGSIAHSMLARNPVRFPSGTHPVPGRIITRPILAPNPYIRKWRRLKKVIKDLMFVNAAICDEVVRVEEKVAKAKEERRFLLRKALHYQSYTEGTPVSEKSSPGGASLKLSGLSPGESSDPQSVKVKNKTKKKVPSTERKKAATTKELLDGVQVKPKKSKSQIIKKVIPPLQLDSTGRPVFPLVLGELTIHSIGEIVTDRPGFHTPKCIYPEGYCSTRVFASTSGDDQKCLYTCKISDSGKGPIFEIAPEDNTDRVLRSDSPSDCHNLLITAVNKSRGNNMLDLVGKGAEFFGLSHPVVQNLIQSCPGSKRCTGYKWVKFEINKMETVENLVTDATNDPSISFEAFKLLTKGAPLAGKATSLLETSTSLRSLLTSKPNLTGSKAASSNVG